MKEDVYQISNVVRGAHSLAIIVSPKCDRLTHEASFKELLEQWGERMWTLPEAMLSTPHRPIQIWRRGHTAPLRVSKTQLTSLAWRDVEETRQLVDHYEGNLILSRLELVIIAMQCLFVRKTKEHFQASISWRTVR